MRKLIARTAMSTQIRIPGGIAISAYAVNANEDGREITKIVFRHRPQLHDSCTLTRHLTRALVLRLDGGEVSAFAAAGHECRVMFGGYVRIMVNAAAFNFHAEDFGFRIVSDGFYSGGTDRLSFCIHGYILPVRCLQKVRDVLKSEPLPAVGRNPFAVHGVRNILISGSVFLHLTHPGENGLLFFIRDFASVRGAVSIADTARLRSLLAEFFDELSNRRLLQER